MEALLVQDQWPKSAIFTVGHSTLPIERFIALLQTFGIECLVDIRTMPGSRHNPQFNEKSLAGSLTEAHIDYVPMQALGGLRTPAKTLPIPAGATVVFAATPTICKPRSFRTRSKRSCK